MAAILPDRPGTGCGRLRPVEIHFSRSACLPCPLPRPAPVVPTAAERRRLKKMAYGHKSEHRLRVRAQVVLHAARGHSNARIARETGLHLDTVRAWRGRFAHGGLPALADRKRSGRPARFTPVQVAEAKALVCQLPVETGVPLSRWTCPELAAELTARGITETVSASTVRRWLREDARSSPGSTGPGSSSATRTSAPRPSVSWICTPGRSRVSRWEKTSTSSPATRRLPSRPAAAAIRPWRRGRPGRCGVNHEYGRGGALAYLAAYDVHHAKVFGRCEPKTGIVPFTALVAQVMTPSPTRAPDASSGSSTTAPPTGARRPSTV
jgi:transposase